MTLELRSLRLSMASFSFEIDTILHGNVTGIFGSSGAGKTTLLELIAGLKRPDSGKIVLNGVTLTGTASGINIAPHRRAIGYVPQDGALFPHLDVRRNLLYGAQSRFGDSDLQRSLNYEHVLEVLEITTLADRSIGALSGGEKQRVALGRALLSRPRLLLLDEPLAGLDLGLKERLLPYLQRIRDEFHIPMLYVTHSADEVMALCDQVLVLSKGKRTNEGIPQDIFTPASSPSYILRVSREN